MTIKEALQKWIEKYPNEAVTTQTIKNWGKKYGFTVNTQRIVRNHKIEVDEEKFEKFLQNPRMVLSWTFGDKR